ncbi:MAG TPA: M28 family peptidase [Candidatus Acidoferrum sp.]|nr:M28 family peptidase [Candidatus Acidoferrum sp.]
MGVVAWAEEGLTPEGVSYSGVTGLRMWRVGLLVLVAMAALGCKSGGTTAAPAATAEKPFMSAVAGNPPAVVEDVPAPEKMDGFDGKRAYEQVVKQVSFGPRPAGSAALAKLQDYLETELKSYGCVVETDSFSADTPAGRLPMKNLLVKIPGEKPGIILLGTHYDTKRLENFVGADDGGSSTGVMLEIARLLCGQKQAGKYAVWIAFFDGEEAVNKEWVDPDNRYGSREMAARLANSGDLKRVRAFILADLVGGRRPHFRADGESTKWLVNLVWGTAAKLGYSKIFLNEPTDIGGDDHYSFTKRNVPSVDIIDLDFNDVPYWHTPEDTVDKISARTMAIVGHAILESVKELQQK